MTGRMLPFLLALLTAAFLWPAEDAVAGQGLTRVLLVVVLAATLLIHAIRTPGATRALRITVVDIAVVALVCGHWLSTWWVFHEGGDRRSALNLSFEWFGLLAFWFLFRVTFSNRTWQRETLVVVVATLTGIASLGIWQHYTFYDQQAEWYLDVRERLTALETKSDAGSALQAQRLRDELRDGGAWYEGAQRLQFEQRLLHSTEPMGTFALANTLAGVLTVAVVLFAGGIAQSWFAGRLSILQKVSSILVLAIPVYCLVLTKSRSAWLGTLVGVTVVLFRASLGHRGKRLVVWGVAAVMTMLLAGLAGIASGALDKEVILEAPQSLQYRLFYWTGTTELLRESPVFGAGPGNFRQLYLPHKVAESSEEIRDPHNLFLDAWTSGGVLALLGLLTLLVCVVVTGGQQHTGRSQERSSARRRLLRGPCFGLLMGLALHAVIRWFEGGGLESAAWSYLLIPVVGMLTVPVLLPLLDDVQPATTAAMLACVTHLLVAGSLQFPAVTLLILLCAASSVVVSSGPQLPSRLAGPLLPVTALAICVLGVGLLWVWGIAPFYRVQAAMTSAIYEQEVNGNLAGAERDLRRAEAADPLAVNPRQRLSGVLAYEFNAVTAESGGLVDVDESRENALERFLAATADWQAADQRSVNPIRFRSSVLTSIGRRLQDEALLQQATDDLHDVLERYPTSVDDWARLAGLLSEEPEVNSAFTAAEAARRALELDRINRDWGHSDRYLSSDIVTLMKAVAAEAEIQD